MFLQQSIAILTILTIIAVYPAIWVGEMYLKLFLTIFTTLLIMLAIDKAIEE